MLRRFAVAGAAAVLALGVVSASSASFSSATVRPKVPTVSSGHIVPAAGRPLTSRQGAPVIFNSTSSGYAAVPKSGGASSFHYVTASFTVPSLNCPAEGNGDLQMTALASSATSAYAGYADGLNETCQPGGPNYFAWYNTPSGGGGFNVSAGDALTSSVFYGSGQYSLKVVDHTTGEKFNVAKVSTAKSTAAVVATVGEGGSNDSMANFGAVHFDTIKVSDTSGHHGGLANANWTTDELIAVSQITGNVEAQPGPLYAASPPAQSAFATNWLSG